MSSSDSDNDMDRDDAGLSRSLIHAHISTNAETGQAISHSPGCSSNSVYDPGPSAPGGSNTCNRDSSTTMRSRDSGNSSLKRRQERHIDQSTKIPRPAPTRTYAQGGLTRSLHGVVYQLKHLMLILKRGWEEGYSFRLATEMNAAEKFDDLVFEYKNTETGRTIHRFVQLKHRAAETEKVSARDLMDVEDGDFSLLKYFKSWRVIREREEFLESGLLKDFILCTNVGLDVKDLKKFDINVIPVKEPDDFLEVTIDLGDKRPQCYKLEVQKNSELHNNLRTASDIHCLAKTLAEHYFESKQLTLGTDIFKQYHVALGEEVIDIPAPKPPTFSDDFINDVNLAAGAKKLRDKFIELATKLEATEKKGIWRGLEHVTFSLSKTFGAGPSNEVLPVADDRLAKALVEHFYESKKLALGNPIFKQFHVSLGAEVIVIPAGVKNESSKFSENFIKDVHLSANAKKLREEFLKYTAKLAERKNRRRPELRDVTFSLSESFRTKTPSAKLSDARDISEDEIMRFFEDLTLAFDQPNEAQLGEMIKDELGDHPKFNLLHANFLEASFQRKMLDWFQKPGNLGEFLDEEDAEKFFDDFEAELSSCIAIGVHLCYSERLRDYGIEFERDDENLKNFLECSNSDQRQIFWLISPKDSLLSTLRVHQTLERIDEYNNRQDSFIFIHKEMISLPGIQKLVLSAFEAECNHHLLVIECATIVIQSYVLNKLCKILKKNRAKKLVVIIQSSDVIPNSIIQSKIGYETSYDKDDDISFNRLTKDSQRTLLGTKIAFQGIPKATSLGELLCITENSEINELEKFGRMIDPKLVQLIRDGDIPIGGDIMGWNDELQRCYIPRTIVNRIVIKSSALADPKIKDLFAISGISRKDFKKLVSYHGGDLPFEISSHTGLTINKFNFLPDGCEIHEFQTLCRNNEDRNVHWLKYDSEKLFWMTSSGSVRNLNKHQNEDTLEKICLTEDELLRDHDNGIFIIANVAGMGKSTVLTSLARRIQENDPGQLIIRIDLNLHTDALEKKWENPTFSQDNTKAVIQFLVNKLSSLNTDFEKQILEKMIVDQGKVVLIFDGFDEISPYYEKTVIELLQAVVKLKPKKLLVASRPHTRQTLEKALGKFSFILQPLSDADQTDLLIKFWRMRLNADNCDIADEKDLTNHAEQVMSLLDRSISQEIGEFIGVPLQTKLVAEAYEYGRTGELPERIDIIDLYDHFINRKYQIYREEKQRAVITNPAEIRADSKLRPIFNTDHQTLALNELFDDRILNILPGSSLQRQVDYVAEYALHGIVTSINDKIQFVHRTYAEYFVAQYLARMMKDTLMPTEQTQEFLLRELFLRKRYKTIRIFLNILLAKLGEETDIQSWDSNLLETVKGETAYHIACVELNLGILKYVHKRLSASGGINGLTLDCISPLQLAAYKKDNLNMIEYLIDNGAEINYKCMRDNSWRISTDRLGAVRIINGEPIPISMARACDSPLHTAVSIRDNLKVVKCLIENGAKIESKTGTGKLPLHYAVCVPGNLETVEELMKNDYGVHSKTETGYTPLHYAALISGNFEMVRTLIGKNADVTSAAGNGLTPLHAAVCISGNLNIVRALIEKGADVYSEAADHFTPLHFAVCIANNSEIVKELLIKIRARAESKSWTGATPLHYAVNIVGNVEIVEQLTENGADVNMRDNFGCTPLHLSLFRRGNFKIIKHLIDNGADVNSKYSEYFVPSHYRTTPEADNLLRLESALDSYELDSAMTGKLGHVTSLHVVAHRRSNLYIMDHLLTEHAKNNIDDKDNRTTLRRIADESGDLELKGFLKKQNADDNVNNSSAAELDVVKYLVEKGADINIEDETGYTPLHRAAAGIGNIAVSKYLLRQKNNIRIKYEDRPMHLAINQEHSEQEENEIINIFHDAHMSVSGDRIFYF